MQNDAKLTWKQQLLTLLPERLQIAAWAMRCHRHKFGHWPNLIFPTTFNELVHRRKVLESDNPRIPPLVDKVLAKEAVAAKLGEEWVTPTLWSGAELPPVAERNWPKPYVIKANNASRRNIYVRQDSATDWPAIEATCRQWMSSTYGIETGEWYYKRIAPQLMVEPFISFDLSLPLDYKFWTFHGRVEFIHMVLDREGVEKHAFFDRHWNRLPYDQGYPDEPSEVPRPGSLDAMIRAAELLAADFSFVRADFYEIDGKPRFGELTFFPNAGLNPLNPPEFDKRMFDLWRGKRPMPVGEAVAATT